MLATVSHAEAVESILVESLNGSSMSDLKRHIGQKVALATSALCALLTLPIFGLFIWLWMERGLANHWVPSALATIFFLGACAVVLYAMSRPHPLVEPATVDPKG